MGAAFLLTSLLLCAFIARCASMGSRIVLTMDRTSKLNPSSQMRFARSIFEYHLVTNASNVPPATDIVVHANWTKLVSIYQTSPINLPRKFANDASTIDLFENKAAWKKWMHSIGLGAYVPTTYISTDAPTTLEYPLVLKTNVHFGRGVHIATSPAHLATLIANVTQSGLTYTLEEALTGMGRAEAASFGSVYQGRLISLRCVKRSFSEEIAQHSIAQDVTSTTNNSSLFIMGFAAKPLEQHMIPCSQELVNVTQTMFQRLNYTGPFCSDIKLDKHMRPKMMEINARFCGTMAANEPIFLSTFVPFTFAALEGRNRRVELLKGTNKRVFERILAAEARALQSGGGLYQGKNITVTSFSSELVLDPISVSAYFGKAKSGK